jgi:hypothetical protein
MQGNLKGYVILNRQLFVNEYAYACATVALNQKAPEGLVVKQFLRHTFHPTPA